MDTGTERSKDELRDRLDATRDDIAETIDEIEERVSPDRVIDRAKDTAGKLAADVREVALGPRPGTTSTARGSGASSPMPKIGAAFGAGLVLGMWRGRD